MKLQLLSDLHLEFRPYTFELADADAVIIAGDCGPILNVENKLSAILKSIPVPVFVVLGNHDVYGTAMTIDDNGVLQPSPYIRAFFNRFPHVTLLHNTVTMFKGVCIAGTPLWTDFSCYGESEKAQLAAARGISDFYSTLVHADTPSGPSRRLLRPEDLLLSFQGTIDWLRDVLREYTAVPTVVVSHWLPSTKCITLFFRQPQFMPLNPYFASNCEQLMGRNLKAWAYGHTHVPSDLVISGTRVVSNPRGYNAAENPSFDPRFTIEV